MNRVDKLTKKLDDFSSKVNEQIEEIQRKCKHEYERFYSCAENSDICKKCNHWK